ncbi:MAG: hypothetical protein HY819_04055 [Acidobacteria bacterium]|nr:hypothetical protein [Acidobacteriota bacterium]
MSKNLPKVIIDSRAWTIISNEVGKWAKIGREKQATPFECVFYPLTTVRLNKEKPLTPFDDVLLKDVKQFNIGSVFIPPEEYTSYSSYAASFCAPFGQEKEMKEFFTKAISEELKWKPQFYFLGPGHSHPFSIDTTSPSSTDINHHMLPYRRRNEELLGFKFSLAVIVVKNRVIANEANNYLAWKAATFALDENNQVQNLGIAEIGYSNDLLQPFYQSRDGETWETLQKAFLGEKLIEHERWPGGWTSFLVRQTEETATLVMLPPRFPAQAPIKQTISLVTKEFSKSEFWYCGRGYKNYCLGEVNNARYLKQA